MTELDPLPQLYPLRVVHICGQCQQAVGPNTYATMKAQLEWTKHYQAMHYQECDGTYQTLVPDEPAQ